MYYYNQRVAKLRKLLRQKNISAFLTLDKGNIFYLTGFTGEDSALVVAPDKLILITDFRFSEQASKECANVELVVRQKSLLESITKTIKSLRKRKIGFESENVSYAFYKAFKKGLAKHRCIDTKGVIAQLRQIKDSVEIGNIRKAIKVAESAFTNLIRKGKEFFLSHSDKEIADWLEFSLRRAGAESASFDLIVASNRRSSLPHARPSAKMTRNKKTILFDFGARVNFYNSDLTRTLFLNRISPIIAKAYETVRVAQQKAIESIKPGVRMCDIDRAARSYIESEGYSGKFGHGLGHGVGLNVHEMPSINFMNKTSVQAGMVFTIEPGIYLPGVGGVRIEDIVEVTKSGCRILTTLPRNQQECTL